MGEKRNGAAALLVASIPRWIRPKYLSAVNAPTSMLVTVLFWCGFNIAAVVLFAVAVALEFLGNVMTNLWKEECPPSDRPRWSDRVLAPIVRLIPGWIKPNHLSLVRAPMLVPVAIFSWCGWNAWATFAFVLAAGLDLLDGPLARIRKEESKEGEWLDAYADKVLVIGLFWLFWFWDSVAIAFGQLVAITAIEVALTLGRPIKIWLGKSGRANNWGKAKMWYQSLAIVSITLGQDCTLGATPNLLWFALGLGFLSLGGHIWDILARSQPAVG